jgi:transposase InsO family protein
MRSDHSIAMLCANLEVSPSGFYDWDRRRQRPGARSLEDQALVEQITAIHAESRQTYGSPRIVDELRDLGHRHGRNRIARLMKSRGICGRQKGRYRVQTDHRQTATMITQLLPISWQKPQRPLRPTRSGSPISPTFSPTRVGSISPVYWTSIVAKSSAGP